MGRKWSRLVLATVAGLVCAGVAVSSVSPVRADRGDLVSTFAGDGTTTIPGGASIDLPADVAVQSDGTVLVLANRLTEEDGNEVVVTGYRPNGRIDRSFGDDGQASFQYGGTNTVAESLEVLPDDRVVLVGGGVSGGSFHMLVARLLPEGQIDTGFGAGGFRVVQRGIASALTDLVVDGSGRIIATGTVENGVTTDAILLRLTAAGARDRSFGNRGTTTIETPTSDIARAAAIELTSTGRYVVAGEELGTGASITAWIARVRPSGRLDTAFGNGGVTVVAQETAMRNLPIALVLGPSDRILLLTHHGDELLIARVDAFSATGVPDPAFGTNGGVDIPPFEGGWAQAGRGALLVDGRGRILVGLSEEADRGRDATVVALRSTGRIDRSFSADGAVTFDYDWETESDIRAMTFAGDRLYAVGEAFDPFFDPIGGGVAAVRLR